MLLAVVAWFAVESGLLPSAWLIALKFALQLGAIMVDVAFSKLDGEWFCNSLNKGRLKKKS